MVMFGFQMAVCSFKWITFENVNGAVVEPSFASRCRKPITCTALALLEAEGFCTINCL